MGKLQTTILSFLIICATVVGSSSVGKAHVLEQDVGISGILHIPPIDEPKAGERTQLYVSFNDKKNAFNLADCNCTITFEKDGKILETVPLRPQIAGATLASITDYQFPSVGAYDILVAGHASSGQFPDFKLPYDITVDSDVRVASSMHDSAKASSVILLGAGTLALVAVFCYAGIKDGGRYRPQSSAKNTDKRK